MRPRPIPGVAILALALLTFAGCGGSPPPTPPPADDAALVRLNDVFREIYRQARDRATLGEGPIVHVNGTEMVLLRGGTRERRTITPPVYHHLKAVSHVPLAIQVLLAQRPAGMLTPSRLAQVQRLRAAVAEATAALDRAHFDEAQLARNRTLLREAAEVLEEAIGADGLTPARINTYAKSARGRLEHNAFDAARSQIDAMRTHMTAWWQTMSADERRRLRVVISGPQPAREGHLATQFFADFLGLPGEGDRILFAEGIFDEPTAISLAGMMSVDTLAGAAIFDDPRRLLRDLLSDGARAYLQGRTWDEPARAAPPPRPGALPPPPPPAHALPDPDEAPGE